jgi:3-carboxy-cis,cis-muconate cycloisomerase
MQIRAGLELVERDLLEIARSLTALARKYRDTPMAARSNLQQAVPITFGYKCACLLAAFQRHIERLRQMKPRVLVGEFGGAAGNLSSLGDMGLKTQEALCKELGLGQPEIAWHTVRDRIAEAGCFLGLVTGTLAKISMDVKLMMQTEVEEAFEPFHEGRGSSSTMPQKRNPIASAYIHGCAGAVRQPEIFCLTSGALMQTKHLVAGLQVSPENMRRNLDISGGLIVSEAVMMGLGPSLGRQRAHDVVYDICRQAIATKRPFLDLLAENPEIKPHMTREQLAPLVDPANYLGQCGEMTDRVLAGNAKLGI